ncbi:MAG TPA: SNF2-related protein [Terriglobia bacterium]|nr:SNF2-related protein [Terriglobia bacterium]
MNLSQRLAGNFSGTVRHRGHSYYWQGRVRIRHGSESGVAANVRGSQNYQVNLDWQDGVLSANCDCLYFDSDGPCKHLWAAILAAEAYGHLTAAASAPKLVLDCGDYGLDEEYDDEYEEDFPLSARRPVAVPPSVPKSQNWLKRITEISDSASTQASWSGEPWPAKRQVLYIVDVAASPTASCLILSLASRDRKMNGSWARSKTLSLRRSQIAQLPLAEDREILSAVAGSIQYYGWGDSALTYQIPASCMVPHPLAEMVMPLVARTGRCYLRMSEGMDDVGPLVWDEGGPWQFKVEMRRSSSGGWAADGVLRRGEERMNLAEPVLMTQGGLVFTRDRVAALAEEARFDWMVRLRRAGAIEAPEKDQDALLEALLAMPGLPAPDVPEELRYEEVVIVPRPGLQIRTGRSMLGAGEKLRGELSFNYDGKLVRAVERTQGFYDAASRRFTRRDPETEKAAAELLTGLGLKFQKSHYGQPEDVWEIAPTKLPRVVRTLVEAGWHIEAHGKVFRRPGGYHLEVATGVDWFELHGKVEYGDSVARLPELLEALKRGENMVRLDDGTYGLLPEEWMRRIGVLAGVGAAEAGHIRFRQTQVGFLDALLASEPEARCDETFTRMREELRQFQGVEAAAQPAGFVGHLRDYQREGLGWMQFLHRFSFGGCLADDMGVGKTAQVLALLEMRRELRAAGEPPGPSLVVVPRSLVFNWKEEAARFTPQLQVLDYTGVERIGTDLAAYDVVLTTYGTLRRDVLKLKEVQFDYVVLDEAQAVKNAATDAAKAARLLRAGHRLALSGTPVENHLGELWSLFEFLNPGMLGAASVFKLTSGAGRSPSEETCRLLSHALRPFILRRTKEQVARELPPKTEQTLYCEMEPVQRKLYQELRQHYRDSLLKRIELEGIAKSKIQVLEALLRLRQAACHPGLIDKKRTGESSAKLETLLEQLGEVLDEGHKALVFSQFTSLLRIVRDRLDSKGVAYQYLDGATRDRKTPVDRFQNDPDCKLFLVSLKAGGLGLNLTAAEYVFLLDPWWNPAVETQAIDRAHRIGQTRQVFAYRIIARDTVEEKVLELQKTKRDLAAAIISADNSLIRTLRREDLELLLS